VDRYYLIIFIVLLTIAAKTVGVSLYYVLTGSMKPTAEKGDIVLTVPVRKVKIGDILSFKKDGVVITHRVVEIREEFGETYFLTKGDSNKFNDPYPIPGKELLGKVIFVVPTGSVFNPNYIPVLYWIMGFTFGGLMYLIYLQNTPQL